MFIKVLISIILLGMVMASIGITLEKRAYNNGVCPECGEKLELFTFDSQGGRGYGCVKCPYHTWVSYRCVDRFGKE